MCVGFLAGKDLGRLRHVLGAQYSIPDPVYANKSVIPLPIFDFCRKLLRKKGRQFLP